MGFCVLLKFEHALIERNHLLAVHCLSFYSLTVEYSCNNCISPSGRKFCTPFLHSC